VKFSIKTLSAACAAALLACVMALPASAAALAPGDALFGEVVTLPAGAALASSTSAFSSGSFSGSLKSEVFDEGLGGRTFVYTLTNDGVSGPNSIGRLSISEFFGFDIDEAGYSVAAGTVAPASIDRNPAGDVVGFNFVPVATIPDTGFLAPTKTSAYLVLRTNATDYKTGGFASLIDGGVATTDAIVPVPEPSTVLLSLIGVAGAAIFARRRS
jgi:hypothetical protein